VIGMGSGLGWDEGVGCEVGGGRGVEDKWGVGSGGWWGVGGGGGGERGGDGVASLCSGFFSEKVMHVEGDSRKIDPLV